ncbi:hypothetical protein Y032_0013g2113 [Ancylostoma ceylanicum]|uniref:Uncharacterized protein n=1 Tax=Ancylostoma ceylanicum TaxID=53326 RepID=A0A016VCM3_9BILA|nr:hypothetical protein Y032_0013g2113 [Ancylostoma ceylanicum]
MQDVEMLDCRLPSALLTFVGAVIQAVMILSMPIYATPTIVFLLAPTIVFYYFILVSMQLAYPFQFLTQSFSRFKMVIFSAC